jgi:hypothetical protein
MLRAIKKPRSADYDIEDAAHQPVGELKIRSPGEAVCVAGVEHKIAPPKSRRVFRVSARAVGYRIVFEIEDRGLPVARAQKPYTYFWRTVSTETRIEYADRQYALKIVRGRGWILYDGECAIGTLVWERASWFSFADAQLRVELPDNLPLVLRLFMAWLVVHVDDAAD